MRHISHGRILPCYDMLAWRVEPGADRSNAFSPHRDRQPDDVKKSFYADDHFPKYASIWVGLANATPESSCLYCLPVDADAGVDAGYYDGDDEDVSPLDKALAGHKERFQDIRALPVADGGALLFSHRLLHWGSRGIRGAAPRISISFGFSDPSFEKPYLRESSRYRDAPPPFHIRLGLIAAQLSTFTVTSLGGALYGAGSIAYEGWTPIHRTARRRGRTPTGTRSSRTGGWGGGRESQRYM